MVPKGAPPKGAPDATCPITGRALRQDSLTGRLQPATPYQSEDNPSGLNDRIKAKGYNPDAYMAFDGAIPELAYLLVDGQRVAKIEPARDRGKFGGWQIVPLAGVQNIGILSIWEMPEQYDLEWCV